MAHAARPLGRRPNPSPAALALPARRPEPPPRAARDTSRPTCCDRSDSRNMTRCQFKKVAEHAQNEVHGNDAVFKTQGISRPDSASNYGVHRSSGGAYSKPYPRVKLIPAEDITYVRHGKLSGRIVSSAGLQKTYCRRSVTPPPSSRKVSLVPPTPLPQKPVTPAPPVVSCLSSKRPETAQSRHSLVGDYITRPSMQIASLNRPSPISKAVRSQHSGTSLVSDAPASKNLSRMDHREAFVRSCSSSVLHQVQSSTVPPARLLKESVMNPISTSSVHVLAAHSSKVPLSTKAEPSSKSVCIPENTKLSSTSCNLATFQCQRTRSAAAPIVQKEHTVEPSLVSPASVLSERSTEVCPDTSSSRRNLFDGKCNLTSLQHETITPPTQSPQSTTPAKCVQLSNDFEAVPSKKSHSSNEEKTDQEASINCNISSGALVILHTKLHKKHYQPEACWKGKFEVIGELTHACDGLEAYFPFSIFYKVYEASKQMPEILKLEALPISQLWPKIFKVKPPDGQDIGLCFISSLQRPNSNFDRLLENISSHIGLRTDIGFAELLLFSSKLLTQDYQTKGGKFYFWGIFKKHLRKKQHQSNKYTNKVEISNANISNGCSHDRTEEIGLNSNMTGGKERRSGKGEIGMKLDATPTGLKEMERDKSKEIGKILDVTGDKQTDSVKFGKVGMKLDVTGDKADRISESLAVLKTPDSNAVASCAGPALSSSTGCCSPDSTGFLCKSATKPPACSDLLDSGFPLDVPSVSTKAHCWFPAGETAESYMNSCPSLSLDTPPGFPVDIPPGFTEAHRGLHSTTSAGSETGVPTPGFERNPPIKFSLNITRLIKTEVPPGFTKLLAVKKEPGLPAVYDTTENIIPIAKVDETKIKHDKMIAGVDASSEEREFPKTRMLSDILGFSPASSNENTSALSSPRNCAEVCRSAHVPFSNRVAPFSITELGNKRSSAHVPLADKFQEMRASEKQNHHIKRCQQESFEPSAADTTKRLKVNGRIALKKCIDRHRALNSN